MDEFYFYHSNMIGQQTMNCLLSFPKSHVDVTDISLDFMIPVSVQNEYYTDVTDQVLN